MQPRIVTTGDGKSSDEIVLELAETLENELPEILDLHTHHKEIFKPVGKGLLHCLATVL